MPTAKEVREALEAMGETSTEVAAFLKERGLRGQPSWGTVCPVFRYLDGKFPGMVDLVTSCDAEFKDEHGDPASVAHPFGVKQFVKAFDQGKYPDLVKWEAPQTSDH